MPEAEMASNVTAADSIAQAHDAFLDQFDQVIAGANPSVPLTPEPVTDTGTPATPSNEEEKVPAESPLGKPANRDKDLEAKFQEDPELKDYLQRKLQSQRDKTIAELNKAAKVTQTVNEISTNNPAFRQDWESLTVDGRSSWIEAQPEYATAVQRNVSEAMRSVATDLMDLLGADQTGITDEMLKPEGRALLKEHLLSANAVASKMEQAKKEAFEAGKAAGRADDRGLERRPPTGTSQASRSPLTMAEAHSMFSSELDRLGLA